MREAAGMHAVLLLPGADDALIAADGDAGKLAYLEERLALIAYQRGETITVNALDAMGQAVSYVPLKAPMRVRGVLAVSSAAGASVAQARIDVILSTFASLVAIAVERLHYVEVANHAQMEMASERLRNSILSALSHDVRTPANAISLVRRGMVVPVSMIAGLSMASIRRRLTITP